MTNPLAILTLHAVNYAITNNKTFVYALGTTILVGILYRHTQHYNFLSPFKYLYSKLKSSNKKVTQSQELLFEDKYFKEYDEWVEAQKNANANDNENANKKECLENMYYTTVRDTINEFYGDVIMCYDHATFSFAYYARTANIPYKYLETISRKYMIETNAPREIHVDIREEYNKSKDKTNVPRNTATSASASATDDPSQGGDCGDSPFVKLKSYNTASNLNLHTTTNETKERTHKFASADNKIEKQETSSSLIIRENANRYSYRGKLSDYEEHHKTFLAEIRKTDTATATTATATTATADTDTTTDNTTSSYADFKNRKLRSAL